MSDSERREQQARYYDDAAKAGPNSPFPGHAHTARMLRDLTTGEAEAYRRGFADARDAAADVCDAFPAKTHGALATAPYAAAEQAADECAAAIRELQPSPRREPTGMDYRGG
jgi:hypothetical protein